MFRGAGFMRVKTLVYFMENIFSQRDAELCSQIKAFSVDKVIHNTEKFKGSIV